MASHGDVGTLHYYFGFNFIFIFIVDGIGYGGGNQDIHRQAENLAGFYFCPARIFSGGFFFGALNQATFFRPVHFCRRRRR